MISIVITLLSVMSIAGAPSEMDTTATRFNHVTVDDGLSQGLVTAFAQDAFGYIWIGTYGGINRYDGYDFRVFRAQPGDPKSIIHNHVSSVCPSPDGSVWVGTKNGVNRWDPAIEEFALFQHDPEDPGSLPDNKISDIKIIGKEDIWIATENGLARYDKNADRFISYFHIPGNPRSLYKDRLSWLFVDSDDRLWVGFHISIVPRSNSTSDAQNDRTVIQRYNSDTDDFDTFEIPSEGRSFVRHLEIMPNGRILVPTHLRGFFEFDLQSQELVPTSDPVFSKLGAVFNMFIASDGIAYMAIPEGLLQYNISTGEQYLHTFNPEDENSIFPPGQITEIFEDKTGLMWFGSNGYGFSTYSRSRYKFKTLRSSASSSGARGTEYVRSVERDTENGFWVARTDNVLHHYDERGRTLASHQFDSDIFELFLDNNGNLWISNENGKLFVFKENAAKPEFVLDVGSRILDIALDPQEKLAIYTSLIGIATLEERASGKYELVQYPIDLSAYELRSGNIFFDSAGRLWINRRDVGILMQGTPSGEIHVFRNDVSDPQSISSDSVSDFIESADGTVWIGTFSGLNRYLPEVGGFERFSRAEGLLQDLIYCLEEDKEGNLWLGTSSGLVKFNPETREKVRYTASDGLQSNEFNLNASCRLRDGDLVFGGIRGVNRFDPLNIPMNTHQPPMVITDMQINGKSRLMDMSEKIVLSHTENLLTFRFAALDFTDPGENHYSFLLEGHSDDWYDAGTQNSVSYHLSPGNYILRARASNNDGVWNEQGITLHISILSAFWQTWWFATSLALISVAAAVGLHFARSRAVQRRADQLDRLNKELEAQMEEISSLNVALNTFDYSVSNALRTPIRHIKHFNEILLEELDGLPPEEIKSYLERTANKTDNLIRLVDALLMLSRAKREELQKEEINFSSIARKIANDLCLDGYPEAEVFVQDEVKSQADMQLVSVLLSNLISNALKYSVDGKPPRIRIGCNANGEKTYFIEDQGVGIEQERMPKVTEPFHAFHTDNTFEGLGLGLATCKLIVERHGGRIWIESELGVGTTVFFTLGERSDFEEF